MRFHFRRFGLAVALALSTISASALAQDKSIVVASTTSTEQSGLFGYLLPIVKEKTGITVKVIAQGTGQALDTGRRGDADVVFVHDRASEVKFVEEGAGVKRFPVMYNDFIVVGPKADPAGVNGSTDILAALKKIAAAKAPFLSRGDDSGTHKAEQRLWKQAGVDVKASGEGWYKETGSGMGPTLNTASGLNGYTLSDRGTWLAFKNPGDLDIAVAGDAKLFNQYGVILVNPEKFPSVKRAEGQAFIDWLVSDEGQAAIAGYKIDGKQLFFPNAKANGA
jgi:tungstate transport system substrate-binding protein